MEKNKVLVVEDNELNMKLVKDLLKIGKYQVFEAVDAERGIQLARKHQPNLILMDIQLPGMNGLCAIKVIKEDDTLKDIPVVALTSRAMAGDEDKAIKAGCIGYITKPINTRMFLKSISPYLN
ncbi:MAG: response regulator [Desulfobacterales bacterium]